MELGKPNIEFQVTDAADPKYLMVADLSKYLHLATAPAIVEITIPGASTPLVFKWIKNQINVFNSNNLGLSCLNSECDYLDLPDGIWCITVKASPDTFRQTKFYLKTDLLRLELDEIYVQNGIQYDPRTQEFAKWSQEVELFLRTAEAAARRGDISMAKKFFDQAVKMIDKKSNCKECY